LSLTLAVVVVFALLGCDAAKAEADAGTLARLSDLVVLGFIAEMEKSEMGAE